MTDKANKPVTGGGFKAIRYVMSVASKVGAKNLSAAVRSKNTCKACAFGTGGQRGGIHNEYSNRIEICNKNIQAQLSDIRDAIPAQIFTDNSIDELKALTGKQLEDLGRIATPLYKAAAADFYQPIDYATAQELIANQIKNSDPQRSFFYASGRSSNEAAFVLQLFARLYGCNHINNCSYYCHQASGVGLTSSIGSGTATIQYGDLHKADLIFVFGANPASNHPRFVKVLLECRQRGGEVVVINPAREAGLVKFASPSNFKSMIAGGGDVASCYVQPHIGGDLAFITGLAKCLLEQGEVATDFIQNHCDGFEQFRQFVQQCSWSELESTSGVPGNEIYKVAQLYVKSTKTVFSWGMGLTHHLHGTDNIEAIANLALLRGMIAGEGKGLLPLRGHSNVQGVGSMGFSPQLKSQVFTAIEKELKVKLPTSKGMDTLACVQAAHGGDIDFAFLLGGNLFSANPDTRFSAQALDAIPFKVMVNSTLNQTHVNGVGGENIILPVRVRDEETQATTQESMFNFLRMSDGGSDRIEGLLSEVDIISRLAAAVIEREIFDFSSFASHKDIRQAIAKVVPGFEQLAAIDQTKQEFHIAGRHFTDNKFPTANQRARFKVPANGLPRNHADAGFRLTTVRSEGQFNTIIYSEEDVYRRQQKRNVVFINPLDLKALDMAAEDKVDIYNETGVLENLSLVSYDIRQGNLMTYFPEANVLVPQASDSRSRTPAFKSVAVSLRKSKLLIT